MTSDPFYLHTDIPPGVTIDEYRRARPREPNAIRRVMAVGLRRSSSGKRDTGPARLAGEHGRAGTSELSRFDHEVPPVTRLRPIRVLLVGRDRRFLRMASVLLSRHGCEVSSTERPSELLDLVERQRPNVVVLDGSDSLSATARAVAALEALPTPVPAVIVYEGARDEPLRHLPLLPKWGGFDEIVSEVERVYGGGWSAGNAPAEAVR